MSQFYWNLRDDVKDLLLSFSNLQTLNEAISQAVKCDYCLFQHCQDNRSRQHMARSPPSSVTSHLKEANIQIDAICVKSFSSQEMKQHMEERLCLYCGGKDHKANNCSKKQKPHNVKTRGAYLQENKDAQSQ